MNKYKKEIKDAFLLAFILLGVSLIACYNNEFIKQFHDSLMVAITFVYVLATIYISDANEKSAKAAREQLVESKRQFEENKQLEFLPVLKISNDGKTNEPPNICLRWSKEDSGSLCNTNFQIRLLNIGIGTAKDMSFAWIAEENIIQCAPLPVDFLRQNDEQKLIIDVTIWANKPSENHTDFTDLRIKYADLLNHRYHQDITFGFTFSEEGLQLSSYGIGQAIVEDKETTNV